MGLDDLVETEVGVAVTATAALFSPRVRGVLRRGAVYGLAGALRAGDVATSAARGLANGVRGSSDGSAPSARRPAASARSSSEAPAQRRTAPRRTGNAKSTA
jgi:nucleoside phosphorylase